MAQTRAHTEADVIRAGLALRARGEEPTQSKLFAQLGRTGQPRTAWKVWEAFRRGADTNAPPEDLVPANTNVSREVTEAYRNHRNTLAALIEQITSEAVQPYKHRAQVLEEALFSARTEISELDRIIEMQSRAIDERDREIEKLTAARASGMPRLILPGGR